MAVQRVCVTIDADVLAEARARVGPRGLSEYLTDALRWQLQHDRLGDLLARTEAASGPIPEQIMEEARALWRGDADETEHQHQHRDQEANVS